MPEQTVDWRRYSRIGVGAILVSGPASLVPVFAPLIVGALLAFDGSPYSLTQISLIISAEILAVALSSAFSNHFVQARSIRLIAFAALGSSALAAFLSAYVIAWPVAFLGLRVAAGLCAGVALTVSGTAVAASGDPDRTQAIGILLGTVVGAVFIATLGFTFDEEGAQAGMMLVALLALLSLPGALLLRADDKPDNAEVPPNPVAALKGVSLSLYLVLFGAFAVTVSDAVVYVLMNGIGERAGLGTDDVAYILSLGIVLALFAGGLAVWLGTRFGRRLPLAIAIGVKLVATVLLTMWAEPIVFAVLLSTTSFFYVFALPYIVGLATATQPDGRGTVLNSVAILIGGAIGPALGGWIGEAFGFGGAGIVAGVVGGLGLLALLLVANAQKPVVDARI